MADRHETAATGEPIPRDMPDQQADADEDPWEVPAGPPGHTAADKADEGEETSSGDVPDTDEAGTGREGTPQQSGSNPEQPVPDEPSA
ncbi:hypothetical protein AB0M97_18565 [Streptomyces sp. NPDC051207]|uniref:hypothetical protein n=1 Tax=Streptomyces sp. NPDC051207 TaxID=3154641 RepID=UPI00342D5D57